MNTRSFRLSLFAAALMVWPAAAKQQASAQGPVQNRLQLSAQQRLEVTVASAPHDSLAVDFTVAVPAAHKFQRHRCLLSGNRKFILKTAPMQRWALRGDTLMVLSEIPLSLRAPERPGEPFVLKFDFVNLDATPPGGGVATLIANTSGGKGNMPLPTGTASFTATTRTEKDAAAAAPAAQPDSANKAAHSMPPNAAAKLDTVTVSSFEIADSTVAQEEARAREEANTAPGDSLIWMLIALLLLGIALAALLSVAGKTNSQTHAAGERPRPAVTPMAMPVVNHTRATAGIDSVATPGSSTESREKAEPPCAGAEETVHDAVREQKGAPAAPALDLFAPEHVASAAPPAEPHRNGHGEADAEQQPAQISLRVLPAEETGDGFEEVASAIDVLIAASSTKPPAAPAAALLLKIDSLRRINNGLQALAAICRSQSWAAPLAGVEGLGRKVLDLQASCEAWLADQSLKLSLALPRSSPAGPPQRREIVEAIVNSLYETRKIAVQGPLYFERRVKQLLEFDLPKLRQQLADIENEEMRKVWEEMGVQG